MTIGRQKELAERAKGLKNNANWQETIERHLFTEVLNEQKQLITQFCDNPESEAYKTAFKAKQAIEWFQTWINDLANSSSDTSDLDSPNSNLIF